MKLGPRSQRNATKATAYQSSTQLLPKKYILLRQARNVLTLWLIATFMLFVCFLYALIPAVVHGQKTRMAHSKLMQDTAPLKDLQQKTKRLELFNQQQTELLEWVESAQPDDSCLQVLSVIADVTAPQETGISIESLDLQLPLEYPQDLKSAPNWAKPELVISAAIPDRATAKKWADGIKESKRIHKSVLKLPARVQLDDAVQLTAEPLSTRMVP